MPRFTKAERHRAIATKLPRAWRVGRHAFVIEGHEGRFAYRDGRRPAAPDAQIQNDEVLARYVTRVRTLIRVFVRKDSQKTEG